MRRRVVSLRAASQSWTCVLPADSVSGSVLAQRVAAASPSHMANPLTRPLIIRRIHLMVPCTFPDVELDNDLVFNLPLRVPEGELSS